MRQPKMSTHQKGERSTVSTIPPDYFPLENGRLCMLPCSSDQTEVSLVLEFLYMLSCDSDPNRLYGQRIVQPNVPDKPTILDLVCVLQ